MKKFILKVLLYLFSLGIVFLLMEYRIGKVPNTYSYKRQCLEQQLDSIQVLVLGSSRSLYGIDPAYFTLHGFNLGNVSQSIYYDTHLTLKYLDQMPKLKYVLINLSYTSLGASLGDGIEAWREYYYAQFWDITSPDLKQWDIKRYSKTYLYPINLLPELLVKGSKAGLINGMNRNGYSILDTTKNYMSISDSLGKERVVFNEKNYKAYHQAENIANLEGMLAALRKRNVQPVFIYPPALSTFYKYVSPTIEQENERMLRSICDKYNAGFYNYFRDSRFVERDFNDNDHLNFLGAAKFSKIINDEILKK